MAKKKITLPKPRFTKEGEYKLVTQDDRLAACMSTLKIISYTCIFSQDSPDQKVKDIQAMSDKLLRQLKAMELPSEWEGPAWEE